MMAFGANCLTLLVPLRMFLMEMFSFHIELGFDKPLWNKIHRNCLILLFF